MKDRNLVRIFWNCGDSQIIEFAIMRARLNSKEKQVVEMLLDQCMSQEMVAERLDVSTRQIQKTWYSATDKLLKIPWVTAYDHYLKNAEKI